MAEKCEEHSGVCTNINNLQKSCEALHVVDEDQWQAINNLRNRPPVWATVILMVMSGIIGVLGTIAFK